MFSYNTDAPQSHVGGKVLVLSASLPNVGPGALKNREDPKLLGTAKESTLLQAATGFYKNFAIECSRSQVSVDMWLFSSAYTDVATLSASRPLFARCGADPGQVVSRATRADKRISTLRSTRVDPRTRSSLRTSLAR